MGMRMPETCWAVSKRQIINLWSRCILLVDSVESTPFIYVHCESTAESSSRPHQPQEADSRSSGSACAPSTLHIVTTGHTAFPCPLMKLSTDNLFAIKQNKKSESRVRSVYWRWVLEGLWGPKWGCHATPAAASVVAVVIYTYSVGW